MLEYEIKPEYNIDKDEFEKEFIKEKKEIENPNTIEYNNLENFNKKTYVVIDVDNKKILDATQFNVFELDNYFEYTKMRYWHIKPNIKKYYKKINNNFEFDDDIENKFRLCVKKMCDVITINKYTKYDIVEKSVKSWIKKSRYDCGIYDHIRYCYKNIYIHDTTLNNYVEKNTKQIMQTISNFPKQVCNIISQYASKPIIELYYTINPIITGSFMGDFIFQRDMIYTVMLYRYKMIKINMNNIEITFKHISFHDTHPHDNTCNRYKSYHSYLCILNNVFLEKNEIYVLRNKKLGKRYVSISYDEFKIDYKILLKKLIDFKNSTYIYEKRQFLLINSCDTKEKIGCQIKELLDYRGINNNTRYKILNYEHKKTDTYRKIIFSLIMQKILKLKNDKYVIFIDIIYKHVNTPTIELFGITYDNLETIINELKFVESHNEDINEVMSQCPQRKIGCPFDDESWEEDICDKNEEGYDSTFDENCDYNYIFNENYNDISRI